MTVLAIDSADPGQDLRITNTFSFNAYFGVDHRSHGQLARALRAGSTSWYDLGYMTVRIAGILAVLITLCIAVFAANRGIGPTPQEQQLSPTTSAQRLADLPSTAIGQRPSVAVVTAAIDPIFLVTTSANPTITGTASNISEISIIISKGKTTPASQYDGPGSVPKRVWGSASGNPRFSLSNGHWSATVDYGVHAPALQPGVYTIAIYGYSHLLTYDYLTVQTRNRGNGVALLVEPATGAAPLRVRISADTWHASTSTVDFGDGSQLHNYGGLGGDCSANLCTTWHTFAAPGVYEVKLINSSYRVLDSAIVSVTGASHAMRWSRLSEQIFRVDKWSLCHG